MKNGEVWGRLVGALNFSGATYQTKKRLLCCAKLHFKFKSLCCPDEAKKIQIKRTSAAQVFARHPADGAKTKLASASYFQAQNGPCRFALESCAARRRQARFLIGEQARQIS